MRVRPLFVALVLPLSPLSGCGSEEPEGEIASDRAVDRATRFTGFEIPWLGREWEGMPLAFLDVPRGRHGSAYLTYGECNEVDPGSGCAYELDIQVDPNNQFGQRDLPRRRIAGVPARVDRDDEELLLFGNRLIVTITAYRWRDVLAAAQALEPVNEPPSRAPRLK
jgi:hypothetical protein